MPTRRPDNVIVNALSLHNFQNRRILQSSILTTQSVSIEYITKVSLTFIKGVIYWSMSSKWTCGRLKLNFEDLVEKKEYIESSVFLW